MLKRFIITLSLIFLFFINLGESMAAKQEDLIYLELKDGQVTIETRPDLAPNHVARIKELVAEGFYDGIVFHLLYLLWSNYKFQMIFYEQLNQSHAILIMKSKRKCMSHFFGIRDYLYTTEVLSGILTMDLPISIK